MRWSAPTPLEKRVRDAPRVTVSTASWRSPRHRRGPNISKPASSPAASTISGTAHAARLYVTSLVERQTGRDARLSHIDDSLDDDDILARCRLSRSIPARNPSIPTPRQRLMRSLEVEFTPMPRAQLKLTFVPVLAAVCRPRVLRRLLQN